MALRRAGASGLLLILLSAPCSAGATPAGSALDPGLGQGQGLWEEGDERCMSLPQLRQAVQSAAYPSNVGGVRRRTVILTTCDLRCLQHLFEPFIHGLESSRDGDISGRLVIATSGAEAYAYCTAQRARHRHHCVLDRQCHVAAGARARSARGAGGGAMTKYQSSYYMALVLKLRWGQQVLRTGTSVLWIDMDVAVLGDPLKVMLQYPDADWLMALEGWNEKNAFPGPARLRGSRGHGTQMPVNGGVYLVHPTPAGRGIMDVWAAVYFRAVMLNRHQRRKPPLDQSVWGGIMRGNILNSTVYSWRLQDPNDPASFKVLGTARRVDPGQERVYGLSAQWFSSHTFGRCGMYQPGKRFEHKKIEDKKNATALPVLRCEMPQAAWDRIMTYHMNGEPKIVEKRKGMEMHMHGRIIIDEEAWLKAGRVILPADEPGAWYSQPGGTARSASSALREGGLAGRQRGLGWR